ncbi:ABC transporter permease [Pedobacter cryoconitis]|uniref:ABC transporter permease n=1 Tax=Pedobacter cryoconitis TaxID=188932 RepID=UPI0039835E12
MVCAAVLSETAAQTLPGIAHVSRIQFGYKLVSYRQNSFNLGAAFVDPGFLQIFDYKYLKGSPASALSDPGSVLLTATTAKKLFGRTDPSNRKSYQMG